MDIIKILVFAIIVSVLALVLKEVKPEYSILCIIIGSIVIIGYIIGYVADILDFFRAVVNKTGISEDLYIGCLKIIGIGYLVEFSASTCRDTGNSSMADKVVLAGKLIIFVVSLPIISNLFNMILDLI
ncbi:MAG: hypothetical protein E7356_00365 [Clostridiales bacterium]|nr:hypothetical protein [Clostridiales bacterium]